MHARTLGSVRSYAAPALAQHRATDIAELSMSVRTEKHGAVWTVVHSRAEARNAMDPASADALVAAFLAFDADPSAAVAVLWGEGPSFCAGWDLKYAASLQGDLLVVRPEAQP